MGIESQRAMTETSDVVIVPRRPEVHPQVSGLVGRKCWKANFAHGGELCLHFGRYISYDSLLMKGKKRGEWQLRTRGTAWEVFTPTGSFSSSATTEATLLQKLNCLVGRKVKDMFVTSAKVLMIEFEGKIHFRVTPTAHDAKAKLPFWKLAMPHHRIASFGPTSDWSVRASNVRKTAHHTATQPVRHPVKRRA